MAALEQVYSDAPDAPLEDARGGGAGKAAADAAARPRRESGRSRQRRQRRAESEASPAYALKVEGAKALGLWAKVQAEGWGALSAADSGRVGGYVTRMQRLRGGPAAGRGGAAGAPGGTNAGR